MPSLIVSSTPVTTIRPGGKSWPPGWSGSFPLLTSALLECPCRPGLSSVRHVHEERPAAQQTCAQRTLPRSRPGVVWSDLDPIDGGGGPLAEVVAVRRGNTCDEPDAAEEFFFAADAVTAEHHLRGPRTLGEGRQHSRRGVQLRPRQPAAPHPPVTGRAGRREVGDLPGPPPPPPGAE